MRGRGCRHPRAADTISPEALSIRVEREDDDRRPILANDIAVRAAIHGKLEQRAHQRRERDLARRCGGHLGQPVLIGAQPRLIVGSDQHGSRALGDGVVPHVGDRDAAVGDFHPFDEVGGERTPIRRDEPPQDLAQQIVGDRRRYRQPADHQMIDTRRAAVSRKARSTFRYRPIGFRGRRMLACTIAVPDRSSARAAPWPKCAAR